MMRHTTLQTTHRRAKTRSSRSRRTNNIATQQYYTLVPRSLSFTPIVVVCLPTGHPSTSQYRSWSPFHCLKEYCTCANYLPIAGHSSQRRMSSTLRRDFYWPHVASGVQLTVAQCASCARRGNRCHYKRRLYLLMATRPREFVAMDYHGRCRRSKDVTSTSL